MTVINTNTAAINAQYNLSKVQSAMDDAMSALSSGKRITSAADDAAGLSIVTFSSRLSAREGDKESIVGFSSFTGANSMKGFS